MQVYLVGGALRDSLLDRPVSERDWCVVGASVDEMLEQGFRPVGKDFPVFLHPETGEEYALARTERKSGTGYHGFTFHTDPNVTIEQDLLRRDLTINAMARAKDGETLIDPYGGQKDIQAKVLRHVSKAFVEDPVRVLRLARFSAFFPAFSVHESTLALVNSMVKNGEMSHLVAERVWQELAKALVAEAPQRFFDVLLQGEALTVLMPEFDGQDDLLDHVAIVAEHLQDCGLRFAAVWGRCDVESLAEVANRLRTPVGIMDLAQMVSKHADRLTQMDGLTAQESVDLFEKLDAFRRPDRFWQWLDAAQVCWGVVVDTERLQQGFEGCQHVDVPALQAKGYAGVDLGRAIHDQRVVQLSALWS